MASIAVQTSANASDIQESLGGGNWFYSESLSYIGKSDSYWTREAGFRFLNITIPQGTTITGAKLTFKADNTFNRTIALKIKGIDVDNCGAFSSGDRPRLRSMTTAQVDWDATVNVSSGNSFDSPDFKSVIQEIINRGGWSSGNAIGIYIADDGSANSNYLEVKQYEDGSTSGAVLTITYGGSSPSASVSPSASTSPSPSPSLSPSASISPSASPSPSPMPEPNPAVLKIAKPGVNVLTNSDPEKLIFSSEFGTLKYYTKQSLSLEIDANNGEIGCKGEFTHDLGYYPFCEVFVSVYIGSPTGVYEYCPFYGAGATVLYSANVKIDSSKITCYGQIDGMSTSLWHFDFLIFAYKNDIDL